MTYQLFIDTGGKPSKAGCPYSPVPIPPRWIWLIGPLLEQANRAGPGPEQAAAIGGIVGGVVGGCFGMAYPNILLVFMLRPSLARALQ